MQPQIEIKFQPIHLCMLLVCGMATAAHAQSLIVDQSLQRPAYIPGQSYHYDAADGTGWPGTGQEFTPSLQGLDFVDVYLLSAANNRFEIAIHKGTMGAPVLGLSYDVIRSQADPDNTHFTFPNRVPLVPGDLYVLEIIQVGGDSGWAFEVPGSAMVNGQTIDMNYPGGRLIWGGVPLDNSDMLFSEGIIVPEPGVTALCVLALVALALSRYRQKKGV